MINTSKINTPLTQLNIIPNPSDGFTKVTLNHALSFDLDITIYDITGKAIGVSRILKGNTVVNMDLSRFPAAVYTVQINGNDFTTTKKLILY